jgi:hypothetical protein
MHRGNKIVPMSQLAGKTEWHVSSLWRCLSHHTALLSGNCPFFSSVPLFHLHPISPSPRRGWQGGGHCEWITPALSRGEWLREGASGLWGVISQREIGASQSQPPLSHGYLSRVLSPKEGNRGHASLETDQPNSWTSLCSSMWGAPTTPRIFPCPPGTASLMGITY